jgi:hypothetical protein
MDATRALVVLAARARSTAVAHALSRVNATLRSATMRAESDAALGACMRAGTDAVTDVVRAFVRGETGAAGLTARCVAEAVGAVVVHRVRTRHLETWGAYAHLWYVCTLVVASAINVDEWRVALVAAGREADRAAVYSRVIATVEARALRDILAGVPEPANGPLRN